MSVELIRGFLGWCTLINWAALIWWWLVLVVAREWTYRVHRKWFRITEERFDEIHYKGMAIFKMSILLFNLTPYLALRIVA